jgi:signal transduction histidine kinase
VSSSRIHEQLDQKKVHIMLAQKMGELQWSFYVIQQRVVSASHRSGYNNYARLLPGSVKPFALMKLRIVHKGIILVAIPLAFGTGFISLLYFGVLATSKSIDRAIMLKDAVISEILALELSSDASMTRTMYIYSNNPMFAEVSGSSSRKALNAYKRLKKLLKDEPSLKVPALPTSWHQLFGGRTMVSGAETMLTTSPFLKQLHSMSAKQTQETTCYLDWLQALLVGGLAVSALLSTALAVFFCLNITNRLLLIVNNTLSLTQGTSLNLPVEGNDEIAELDQFLYKSALEIRELERFKKEMVGVVSHELKSPLSSVGGFLSLLDHGVFGELSEKARGKVQRTYSSVKRLMGLVGELLYLDRLELDMNLEDISIDELLHASVDTVKELSEQSGIDIIIKSNGGRVYADRNRLLQVIVNLLSNAMKFSPAQGKVTVEAGLSDGWFECRISDEGRGIPEAFRKQIFEPFKQVDAADATAKKGTGLGLTISRSIVEQHGGTIGVDSEEGKGSTFWFKIRRSGAVPGNAGNLPATKPDAVHDVTAVQLRTMRNDDSKPKRTRKFSVLQQGLVIISLPLIFQFGFVCVIGAMLSQTRAQLHREESSKEALDSIIRGADAVESSLVPCIVYVYNLDPAMKNIFETSRSNAIRAFEKAMQFCMDEPEQLADLKKTELAIKDYFAVYDNEVASGESRSGFLTIDRSVQNRMFSFMGIRQPSLMGSTNTSRPSMDLLMSAMRTIANDSLHRNVAEPCLKMRSMLDKVMEREMKVGRKLSKKRSDMIRNLELTLAGGIVLSIILSVSMALFLMRSLTSRLQHVMANTNRLVKREALDPPIRGSDEIAYLDRVLFEAGNRLVELETFKRELISVVSHELRTPLLSISSALELFESGMLGELFEKGKLRLRYAQEEASRLIRLINDLLDIEKMEAGKFVLDCSNVNAAELIASSISAVASLAEQRGIKIESRAPESNGNLWADRDRLCQVMINLLSNAIKYSPDNASIKITVDRADNQQMKFCVSDKGRGIPDELRQKIFDRFVQVEKTDADQKGGTGLGLAIAKAIIEQHGGEIGVDSEPGAGSTFWFKLPINRKSIDQ